MITLGLTGNRYSGKKRVADVFRQIQVPVFDADTVIKFILNYNYELLGEMKSKLGKDIFLNTKDNELKLNLRRLSEDALDKVLDFIEEDLFKAYNIFNKNVKLTGAIYTIFSSSILFERKWQNKLDLIINISSTDTDRIKRCKYMTNKGLLIIKELTMEEIPTSVKNKLSDYIITNDNEETPGSIPGRTISTVLLKQINDIDQKIIDEYIYKSSVDYVI